MMSTKFTRVMGFTILVAILGVSLRSHFEHNQIISALTSHEQQSIEAFSEVNRALAVAILQRVEAQKKKDALFADQLMPEPQPTPTPRVITKTKTRTKIIRPTPKPFRFFGPN